MSFLLLLVWLPVAPELCESIRASCIISLADFSLYDIKATESS
jgi:hypothetical protein